MLPISIIGYYLLNRISEKGGMIFLLVCSMLFIGYTDYIYVLCLGTAIIFNYCCAKLMNSIWQNNIRARRILLIIGIVINVLGLGVFKYYDFFVENINDLFKKDYAFLNLILPLGISFYTFQQISYIVDCYRDKDIKSSFLEYALYVSFYPQFIQGPIVFQSGFMPQIRSKSAKKVDYEYIASGLCRFTLGLAKKVLIADGLAKIIDGGYQRLNDVGALASMVLIFGYSLQIYFDFSGYSDMAVGIGKMFHIDLPENFESPYKACNIEEFWDRWHITLTKFFTQYVYIPLGGSRRSVPRTYLNIFLIFLISGFWHGAEWSFVIWGIMHGIAMMICRACRRKFKIFKEKNSIITWISRILTYIYVSFAWVFFRADDTQDAIKVIGKLFKGGWDGITVYMYESFSKLVEISWLLRLDILELRNEIQGLVAVVVIIALTVVCMCAKNSRELTVNIITKPNWAKSIGVAVLLVWSILSFSGVNNYIYWNF